MRQAIAGRGRWMRTQAIGFRFGRTTTTTVSNGFFIACVK